VFLIVFLVGWSFAGDDRASRRLVAKPNTPNSLSGHPRPDRDGGEDIPQAVVIPGLPITESGNTCDNLDDYDEICYYAGSTSPDVVYSYTPPGDEVVAMDLCHAQYDTKIYVYDEGLDLVGCNDDYYFSDTPGCFTYASYMRLLLEGGTTYYIVVDGYGGDCGDYVLEVTGMPYAPLACDVNAQPENEPPPAPGYVDLHNGGCNSDPEVFQALNWIDEETGCMHLSGISGWYPSGGLDHRDTDWFRFVAASEAVTVSLEVENWMTMTRCMMTAANPTCATYGYTFQSSEVVSLQPESWTVPTTPGATYWIMVAPADWITGYTGHFGYCLEVCGNAYDIIGDETVSWGAVKSIYR
jgi:hypothetical protein